MLIYHARPSNGKLRIVLSTENVFFGVMNVYKCNHVKFSAIWSFCDLGAVLDVLSLFEQSLMFLLHLDRRGEILCAISRNAYAVVLHHQRDNL
jgi:hypothetical protein